MSFRLWGERYIGKSLKYSRIKSCKPVLLNMFIKIQQTKSKVNIDFYEYLLKFAPAIPHEC